MSRKLILSSAGIVIVMLAGASYWYWDLSVTKEAALKSSIEPIDARRVELIESVNNDIVEVEENAVAVPDLGSPGKVAASQHRAVTSQESETDEEAAASAQWRIDAGYGSDADMGYYATIPMDELTSLAERDDLLAAYWAGLKLASAGREEEARSVLFDAASEGSIAAARLMSHMYAGYYAVQRDVAEAEAWRRVAQAMGDPPGPAGSLTSEEATVASHLFSLYWQEINARYLRDHGVALPILPFPGG